MKKVSRRNDCHRRSITCAPTRQPEKVQIKERLNEERNSWMDGLKTLSAGCILQRPALVLAPGQ